MELLNIIIQMKTSIISLSKSSSSVILDDDHLSLIRPEASPEKYRIKKDQHPMYGTVL